MARIVVVGSGIAGLTTAIRASEGNEVTLITKDAIGFSNTRYAQGGIAGVMFDDDNVEDHIRDTLTAGAGLCDEAAVRVLCSEGPARIRELIEFGVAFDRDGDHFAQGREAAHSYPRVLHAGGDATGSAIETALVERVRQTSTAILEHTFLIDVVLGDGPDGVRRVVGVRLRADDGTVYTLEADAVVLATGGAGQLYPFTTNPLVATGDGAAAALRAGALLADIEFYQFHPTAMTTDGNFLVSEAVRGDGAVLRNAAGERFMTAVHPDAELAPRDVVARGIAAAMTSQGGAPVVLDATALGAEFLARRFPGIDRAVRDSGIDWSREFVPVTPAAHYWMGGVATDLWGRTSLPGLFAVGEVARTGVHGANRLASNSLLEGAVFGARAAQALSEPWPEAAVPDGAVLDASSAVPDLQDELPAFSRTAIQELMWDAAGLLRQESGLSRAAAVLHAWSAHEHPLDAESDYEDRNLLALSTAIVTAARARFESRGAHARSDFPELDPAQAHPLFLIEPEIVLPADGSERRDHAEPQNAAEPQNDAREAIAAC